MAKPVLSGFADEYNASFDAQLEGFSELGINFLELRSADTVNVSLLTGDDIKAIKKKLLAKGIGVSAIGSPIGKIKTDADICEELKKAERVFGYANELGAKYIRMFSFYPVQEKTPEENKSIVYSSLEKLVKLAGKYNVVLCHENEANIYGETPEACLELMKYFGGELKCVFDMGNFVLDGCEPYPHAYELLREYIEYFHIKDSLSTGAIVPPGCGEANIAKIIEAHNAYAKEDYFISLEPHLDTFEGLSAMATKKFENPYVYESRESAFIDAAKRLKALI